MDIENLQLIQRTQTANSILAFLIKRERISFETTLDQFKSYLLRKGISVNKDEFHRFFKDLEEAGVGELEGNQFKWYYSLKSISEQILNPNKKIDLMPLAKEPQQAKKMPAPIALTNAVKREKPAIIQAPKSTAPNVVYLFKLDSGDPLVLNFNEINRLITEVTLIKTKLNLG